MRNAILGLAVATALAGCGNSEEEAQESAQQAAEQAAQQLEQAQQQAQQAQQQAQQAAQAAQPAQPAQPAGDGTSNFGTVTLAPGFTPDPHVVNGTSGGSVDASTLSAGCNGTVSTTPDHLFVAQGAFSTLRVMAHSNADTTLVIQKPDNTYACNDDGDSDFNPIVEIQNAPAGTYKVWIGSYNASENAPYRLGFTELQSVTPASLNN